jgi:predicted AlkP superfamily pyrophosphatase or phosphodiesterase
MKNFWCAALATALLPMAAQAQTAAKPKLIVAISVDQFSADLFAEYRQTYVAGMKRLANGVVFPSGYQSHAATETCPGHSTILTGSHPARTGIIANEWIDHSVSRGKAKSHVVYCAEDERQPGTTSSSTDYFVSPLHLRTPTLGDRMKRADPHSRVVAVAGKDRAAVMMGGHMTDAIWYLDPRKRASYVTLPDRDQAAPAIVQQVNARVAEVIAHPSKPQPPPSCASRSSPIKLSPEGPTIGVLSAPATDFRNTPEFDATTADIAIGLLASLKLGHGPAPDLLAIGLSANDAVGHAFGTEGAEMCAQQAALDRTVGRILAALDANGAPYVVVLTADHGGYDAPERHAERGMADAGRLDAKFSLADIGRDVAGEFGLDLGEQPLLEGAAQGDVWLSPAVPAATRPQVLAAVKAKILAFPQVAAVFRADEIARSPPLVPPVDDWSLLQKARASYDGERSGDLLVFLVPRIIPDQVKDHVATHGSPWNYDRRVPMLFLRPGQTPFEQPLSVETVDILPTLAALIDLKVPQDEIDGRCLDLDPGPGDTCPASTHEARP